MEKVDLMVLAPHEDDELAIAGPVLYQAAKDGMKVKVVFSTNGDFYPHEGPIRIREALNALKVLGVERENIIFLGYGDQSQCGHLYNAGDEEVICSHNGNDMTYGIPDMEEFSMKEYGIHHKYTRKNFKSDMKAVLTKYFPKIIITTDWDNHMDHIALSLMLDEVLGEMLRENNGYQPLVLKSQAYTGKWEGREDYYSARNITENVNLTCGTANVHPLNKWDERLRFLTPEECRTTLLKDNILYKAARQHKSQNVDLKAMQFINQDIIFWRRHTESLSYRAKVVSSSGKSDYLNDFKCLDCADIVNDFWNYNQSIWITDETDTKKSIEIELEDAMTLTEIDFFENPAACCCVKNIKILFDNGEILFTGELEHDGSRTRVSVPQMSPVKKMFITIVEWQGEQIGLTEVEIYSQRFSLGDYSFPLELWNEKIVEEQELTMLARLESKLLCFVKYARGRLWPDKFFLLKRYDTLKVTDSEWVFWKMYIKFVMEKVLEKVR